MIGKRFILVCLVTALVTAFAGRLTAAPPAASEWAETEHGRVRLIAAVTAVGDDVVLPLGLEFQMKPGWHIYWRSPGDAGYPPRADWSASQNLQSAEVRWPAPHRFSVLDMQTIGYADQVVLPVAARLQRPGTPLTLHATVDYLTCADICVPYVAELALDLPVGAATPSVFAHDIARADAQVPGDGGAHRLVVERVVHERGGDGPVLAVSVRAKEPFASPDVFAEAPPPLVFGAPRVTYANDGLSAVIRVAIGNADGLAQPLDGLPMTVTIVDGGRAIEQAVTLSSAGPASATQSAPSVVVILVLALLGGLILNLMPCVLPVLSMKLLAVVGHGGGERRAVRAGFVAAALGIMFSFMLLAGVLIALQATGSVIGWGLQFQQPWFLTAMILVVILFACSLWGVVEIPLPRVLGVASEHASRVRGLAGHFLTGALATLLATPCSAPFLGTAVGFALARGPAEIILVFAAVATGLAIPYLCVAAFPGLATALPKPGRWMATLRRALALPLVATAVWLTWVLAGSIGWPRALTVAFIIVTIIGLIVCRRLMSPQMRQAGSAGLVVLAIGAFLVANRHAVEARPPAANTGETVVWQPFDPTRISSVVADGGIVWVNVTADWCLTCKVNERFVLNRDPVVGRLAAGNVVAMRGDWTQPDEGIARYLAGFGRYGIPFDAVFGPALPTGKPLPELLTEGAALAALDRAAGQ